jgi:hypothetical protein
MVPFERFERWVGREWRRLPEPFRAGVSAVIAEERVQPAPSGIGLYIMGHYIPAGITGPVIVLYFGSFARILRHRSPLVWRREIARTLAHELLHHWEGRAGIDALGDEDRCQLLAWKRQQGSLDPSSARRDLIEALLFLYAVLLGIAVLARWLS